MKKQKLKGFGAFLSESQLDSIAFKRSAMWNSLIEKYSKAQDDKEIALNELEELYSDETEDSDESDSDMAEEVDELEDDDLASNMTNSILLTEATQLNSSLNSEQLAQVANTTFAGNPELLEILQQTLPVIEAHKRKWRETGLERIFNTFDSKKIETEVGDLMLYKDSVLTHSPKSDHTRDHRLNRIGTCKENMCRPLPVSPTTDSDTDSVDSVRYIRSNRKPLGLQKRYSTTLTTIKSYRMVKSKREKLNAKYSFLDPDDTMQVKASACLRNRKDDLYMRGGFGQCGRKRCNQCQHKTSSVSYSSNDDDEGQCLRCSKHSPCNRVRKVCSRSLGINRSHYTRKFCTLGNRFKSCCLSTVDDDEFDLRPYRLESECNCRVSEKLCSYVRHIANSSTEEWLVENCESPKKPLSQLNFKKSSATESHKAKSTKKRNKHDQSEIANEIKLLKLDSNISSVSKQIANNEDVKLTKRQTPHNSVIKTTKKNVEPIKTGKLSAASKPKIRKKEKKVTESGSDSSFEIGSEMKQSTVKKNILKPRSKEQSTVSDFVVKPKPSVVKKTNYDTEAMTYSALHPHPNHDNTTFFGEVGNICNSTAVTCEKSLAAASQNGLSFTNGVKMKQSTLKKKLEPVSKKEDAVSDPTEIKCLKLDSYRSSVFEKISNNENVKLTKKPTLKKSVKKTAKKSIEPVKTGKLTAARKEKIRKKQNNATGSESDSSFEMKLSTVQKTIRELRSKEQLTVSGMVAKPTPPIVDLTDSDTEATPSSSLHPLQGNTTFFKPVGNICNSTAVTSETPSASANVKNASISKKAKATTTVTTSKATHSKTKKLLKPTETNSNSNDCTLVSSTTDVDVQQQQQQQSNASHINEHTASIQSRKIVLYTPHGTQSTPAHTLVNGSFHVTEEHLGLIIGNEKARKFLKSYFGPRKFKLTSTVYYKPPKSASPKNKNSSCTESDTDIFDLDGRYGELYESLNSH